MHNWLIIIAAQLVDNYGDERFYISLPKTNKYYHAKKPNKLVHDFLF